MRVDDRPTIAAPDDDPYLWLEEVEGARALDFVEQQNRRTLEKFGGAQFAADRDMLAAIYDRPDNIPYVRRRGKFLYNLWKDANNPRGLWRRTTLEQFRMPNPQWETLLDVDRLAAEEDKDWLWSWTATLPTNPRASDLEPFARRQRRCHAARIRYRCEGVRDRRLRAAGSKRRRRLDRRRYAAAVERVWRGHGDNFRLCPNRQTMAARRAGGSGAGDLRSADRPHGRVLRISTTPALSRGSGSSIGWISSTRISGSATKRARKSNSNCRPMSGWRPIATGSSSNCGPHGRSVAEPSPRTSSSACRFRPSSPATAISLLSSSRGHGAPCRAGSGPRASLCCRSSTNCARCSRSARPRQTAGPAKDCADFREIGVVDVWRLDVQESESNGDLNANIQDPLTPPSLMLVEDFSSPTLLKQAPRTFSADGLVITQHEAISIDGERIPYVQTGPAAETGDAPVYMTAYGGFGPCGKALLTVRRSASCGSSAAAPLSRPTSAAAASSARAGTMPAAMPASGLRMTISPPSPPTSCGVA